MAARRRLAMSSGLPAQEGDEGSRDEEEQAFVKGLRRRATLLAPSLQFAPRQAG